jgi:hypothetical protein
LSSGSNESTNGIGVVPLQGEQPMSNSTSTINASDEAERIDLVPPDCRVRHFRPAAWCQVVMTLCEHVTSD